MAGVYMSVPVIYQKIINNVRRVYLVLVLVVICHIINLSPPLSTNVRSGPTDAETFRGHKSPKYPKKRGYTFLEIK